MYAASQLAIRPPLVPPPASLVPPPFLSLPSPPCVRHQAPWQDKAAVQRSNDDYADLPPPSCQTNMSMEGCFSSGLVTGQNLTVAQSEWGSMVSICFFSFALDS